MFAVLLTGIYIVLPLSSIGEADEAPRAVVGEAPRSGLFACYKFSSAPFIMDAVRNDVAVNGGAGDRQRRIFLMPRAQTHRLIRSGNYVNFVATPNDRQLWRATDKSAFDLALSLAGNNTANIEYRIAPANRRDAQQPQPDAAGGGLWQDRLGITHHEAGTLFMGAPGASITDSNGKFHDFDNVYVAGPALFPTLGSANPSLTSLALARRTARAIVARTSAAPSQGFTTLSLAHAD